MNSPSRKADQPNFRERPCPHCQERLDAAAPLRAGAFPKQGGISICAYCGEIAVFGADLSFQVPDPMELLRIQLSAVWPQIERAQRAIKRRWERRKARP